jgi:hypothetical protein
MDSPPPTTDGDTILFRPTKKRKIYRQRHDDTTPPETQLSSPNPSISPAPAQPNPQSIDELIASSATLPTTADEEAESTQVSISEILRLRQRNKNKRSGVEFRASGHIARDQDGELVIRHATATATGGEGEPVPLEGGGGGAVIRKFAPQTGTVGDVNKHM